jgi:molybdate transport system substrate-binding protein
MLIRNRSLLSPMLAMLILALSVAGFSSKSAIAQGITIDCAQILPTATIAASPSADTAAIPAAEEPVEVAFPDDGGELTIFAAASLTAAFEDMGDRLEEANPGLEITYNFAGSQELVTQLSEGAEADVFAAASNGQMKNAVEAEVIDGTPTVFTQNRLAIVVPADNPAGIHSYADLSRDLDLVLALPDVPVGQYARQSICTAGENPDVYGAGFVDAVAGNVVSEEDNVKAVLTKVAEGEAQAGIVYTTDVTADVAESVQVIEVPADVNVVTKYPIAPVAGGDAELAAAFISFVLSVDGQAILQEYGFEPKP